MRLKDRVALVTGAGRGIGQAIALAFAREGARVAVTDIDPTTAQATARRIGRAKALALQMDVADAGSVRDGFDAIHRAWGRIDVAVTNAAVEPIVPFLELSEATWGRIIDVNLKGTFLVAQAATRRMVRRRRGASITLSSVNAAAAPHRPQAPEGSHRGPFSGHRRSRRSRGPRDKALTLMAVRAANIGPKGRRRRALMGVATLAVGVVALVVSLMSGVDRGWRVALVVPFWARALGVSQARAHT